MKEYHKIGRKLAPRQRTMYFQIGAEVESSKRSRMGFAVDADYCHEIALAALEAVNWKSLKAARAMLTATKSW